MKKIFITLMALIVLITFVSAVNTEIYDYQGANARYKINYSLFEATVVSGTSFLCLNGVCQTSWAGVGNTSWNQSLADLLYAPITEPKWSNNYSVFLTHITWDNVMNGTLFKTSQWNSTNTSYLRVIDWNSTNTSYLTSESDPSWTGNVSIFNSSWLSTYNQTENQSITNYINSNNNSIVNWVNNIFVKISDIVNQVGNWSADKSSYTSLNILNNGSYLNYPWNSTNTSYMEIKNWNATNTSYLLVTQWNSTNTSYVPYTGANKNVNLGNNNFTVNGTTFFVDTNNSRVGIGTTSPGTALDVVGAVRSSTYFSAGGGSYTLSSSGFYTGSTTLGLISAASAVSGGARPWVIASGDATHTGGYTSFVNDGGTEAMRIVGGNVGIGTTTPGGKLDIDYATAGIPSATMLSLKNTLGTNNPQATFELEHAASNLLQLYGKVGGNALSPIMAWNLNNYNVGIGTTNPFQRLHVNGSILANGTINATTDLCIQGGVCLSEVGEIGNWSADKGNYYNTTQVNDINTSMDNYVDTQNTSQTNYINSQNISQTNSMTSQNSSQSNSISSNNLSVTNALNTKLNLSGGSMTGNLTMGENTNITFGANNIWSNVTCLQLKGSTVTMLIC